VIKFLVYSDQIIYFLGKFNTIVPVPDLLNMPTVKRRKNLGRRTRNATNQINYQSNRTALEREDRMDVKEFG